MEFKNKETSAMVFWKIFRTSAVSQYLEANRTTMGEGETYGTLAITSTLHFLVTDN